MNKHKGGGHNYSFDTNEEILIVRWLDNTVANTGTNYDTAEVIDQVTRWKNKL